MGNGVGEIPFFRQTATVRFVRGMPLHLATEQKFFVEYEYAIAELKALMRSFYIFSKRRCCHHLIVPLLAPSA